jgi:hypothetical protein
MEDEKDKKNEPRTCIAQDRDHIFLKVMRIINFHNMGFGKPKSKDCELHKETRPYISVA